MNLWRLGTAPIVIACALTIELIATVDDALTSIRRRSGGGGLGSSGSVC